MPDLHSLMMLDHVQEKLEMGRKHLDHYRRKGLEMPDEKKPDEEMKVLATGDVHFTTTNPQASPQPQQKSSGTLGKVLAGAALAAGLLGIPAAAIIGYGVSQWAAQKTDGKPVETEDTNLDIGLGRFEDLLPE